MMQQLPQSQVVSLQPMAAYTDYGYWYKDDSLKDLKRTFMNANAIDRSAFGHLPRV